MACCCIARFRLDPIPNKPAAASGVGMYVARASWLSSIRLQQLPSLPVRVRSMADQERARSRGSPMGHASKKVVDLLAAFQGFPAHLQVDDHLISSYLVFPLARASRLRPRSSVLHCAARPVSLLGPLPG